METASKSQTLLKVGGVFGLLFAAVWVVCGGGYLLMVGIPSEPAVLEETIELLRRPSYQFLFWLWPIAYLAAIPFALAAREYLGATAPVRASVGAAFLLLYAGLWFVFHAAIMAAISLSTAEPVDPALLGLVFTVTGTLGSPLFWCLAIFQGMWASVLLKAGGLHRLAGLAFSGGAIFSVIYFVMRYTGPLFVAELVHEGLILGMVGGVGCVGALMVQASRESSGV